MSRTMSGIGEPARVEEERLAEPVAHGAHLAQVGERDRLAAAGVVGDRHEHHGHRIPARVEERLEGTDVHVALERMERGRNASFGDHEVDRLRAGVLDVRARRVEVRVVRDDLPRPADGGEEDLLGGPALVGRDHVLEGEELADGIEEGEPGWRPRVALVAVLDRRPLVARHRPGAGVGEQVDEHVVRMQAEQV